MFLSLDRYTHAPCYLFCLLLAGALFLAKPVPLAALARNLDIGKSGDLIHSGAVPEVSIEDESYEWIRKEMFVLGRETPTIAPPYEPSSALSGTIPSSTADSDSTEDSDWDVVEQVPWYLSQPFVTVRMGFVYAHPLLKISSRYGPSLGGQIGFCFWGKRFGFGLFIMPTIDVSGTHSIRLSGAQTLDHSAAKVEGRALRSGFGMDLGVILVNRSSWLLDAHLGVGVGLYQFAFRESENKEIYYNGIDRRRVGGSVSQSLLLTRWFGSNLHLRVGWYGELGIVEAWSRDDDTPQVDLGRKDNTSFGLELWPYVVTGIRIVRAESPATEIQDKKLAPPIENHVLHFDWGIGGAIPFGKISKRAKPGFAMVSHWLLRLRKQEFGLFFHITASPVPADELVLEADNPNNPIYTELQLPSESVQMAIGVVWNPFVWFKKNRSMHLGLHLGGFSSYIARGAVDTDGDGDVDTPEFEEYSSKRFGVALGQHLDLVWYFFQRTNGAVGWLLRLNIDEVKSFGVPKYHAQFEEDDIPKYGIEFYPSISIGIKASI